MTKVMEELFARRSVREFENREIEPEIKGLVLKAATMAPTAGNQQLYTILDITDQALKDELVDVCDHQPFIAKGKIVLVFLADCKKWYDAYLSAGCEPRKPGAGDLFLAMDDALIAAQNAVVAAQSLGIGSCYIGDVMENCERMRALLNLPRYVFPAALLVFGYPVRRQMERVKPERADMKHIVHENIYRPMQNAELKEMLLKNCSEERFEEWLKAFCTRKYNSDFAREMTRSVEEYLKQFE